MNSWREQVVTKEYVTFGYLYDSFPVWLDTEEVGGYLDRNTPERYKKILFDFVGNLWDVYYKSIVEVFSYYEETIPQTRFSEETEDSAKRIAWWFVRSCDKYAEAIYQDQKMLDDSKRDKTI